MTSKENIFKNEDFEKEEGSQEEATGGKSKAGNYTSLLARGIDVEESESHDGPQSIDEEEEEEEEEEKVDGSTVAHGALAKIGKRET